ncbi:hypothetical protein B0H66DRAFT_180810 [Apodospora peruviana]|uniref:Uncharacterized protein n=1 Tax=Apodospora peruviana TaxID=516989 RepID=A0AAE0M703_9PEZI|nr:hypothetical protein B0H66DRAFT_180810 [Apodospora peruviana]
MRSPAELIASALGVLERRFVPWHTIWWNHYTPRIPRGERYQDGYFNGYGDIDSSDDEDVPVLDIRKAIASPFWRKIYKAMPYIDVTPVRRPVQTMTAEQRAERENFVIKITMAMYNDGKALYTRETIQDIENQLEAQAKRMAGKRPVGRLLSRCEAPQTAWVKYTDFDGVVQHQGTWLPNAVDPMGYETFGRSQIEFRTIQELSQPDPDNFEVFAPDQWEPSVAYNAVFVHYRDAKDELPIMHGFIDDQMSVEDMLLRLVSYRDLIRESDEWAAISQLAAPTHPENGTLRSIDKVVFFYSTGLSDDCDFCQRAMFLLALATCIRELVITARQDYYQTNREAQDDADKAKVVVEDGVMNGAIPIYMPGFDIARTWNDAEHVILRHEGVIPIDSNGELFLKVDSRAAVISYRNWNPVKQVVADIARPALMVCKPPTRNPAEDFGWTVEDRDGTTVKLPNIRAKGLSNSIVAKDPDSPRVRQMLGKGYDKFGLPELPGDTVAREVLGCFVRRAGTNTEVEYWT